MQWCKLAHRHQNVLEECEFWHMPRQTVPTRFGVIMHIHSASRWRDRELILPVRDEVVKARAVDVLREVLLETIVAEVEAITLEDFLHYEPVVCFFSAADVVQKLAVV